MKHRIAFIGCGRRALEHAKGLAHDPRAEVVALADPKHEAAEGFNEQFGYAAPIFADHREMLGQIKPDVILTSLWTELHLPVFRDCVEAGVKAVLSEKPMAPTWGESREMARLAEESGVKLTFSHQRRYAKGNQLARKLIRDGVFGKIERMDLYSPPNLVDCGTHTFDQALSFNDEITAKWVHGTVDVTSTVSYFNLRAEGMATGLIVFQNGVRAYFQNGGPDMDIWGGVRVHGEKGFFEIIWDGQFKRAVVYDDPSWKLPDVGPDSDEQHMTAMIKDALDAIEDGHETEVSYKHALRTHELIFALYESMRRRRRVELPFIEIDDNPFLTMLDAGEFGEIAST